VETGGGARGGASGGVRWWISADSGGNVDVRVGGLGGDSSTMVVEEMGGGPVAGWR
jgi:hypothetical protein